MSHQVIQRELSSVIQNSVAKVIQPSGLSAEIHLRNNLSEFHTYPLPNTCCGRKEFAALNLLGTPGGKRSDYFSKDQGYKQGSVVFRCFRSDVIMTFAVCAFNCGRKLLSD